MAAQAVLGQFRTILAHHPLSRFPHEHRSARIPIVLVAHATFYADPVSRKYCIEVVWHEIVAWAKTVAIRAAAETAMRAVGFVFHAAHIFVAERANEVVEILVCES